MESISESCPGSQGTVPQVREEDDRDPIHDNESRDDGNDDEPEPQEDVNLLIDDVERQDAEGIMLLNIARRSVPMEGTLCHSWKHFDHWICSEFLIQFGI